MNTVLAFALALLLMALCAVREPTPDDRTLAQLCEAARRAGWLRCTGRILLVGLVPAMYVLAAGCWMCWNTARGGAVFFFALGDKLATFGGHAGLEAAA